MSGAAMFEPAIFGGQTMAWLRLAGDIQMKRKAALMSAVVY
jgi:acyl-CoA hydrolase